jgi:hypothetical protein
MSILAVILIFVIVGILLWAINTYIPMQETVKRILNIGVIILLIIWIIRLTGLFGVLGSMKI